MVPGLGKWKSPKTKGRGRKPTFRNREGQRETSSVDWQEYLSSVHLTCDSCIQVWNLQEFLKFTNFRSWDTNIKIRSQSQTVEKCYGLIVTGLVSSWEKVSWVGLLIQTKVIGKKGVSWENVYRSLDGKHVCQTFSWYMIDVGGFRPFFLHSTLKRGSWVL